MVVRVFISGISGNKEVKKRQQRVLLILDSKNIKYDVIDIAEPGSEEDKDFMQTNSKSNGGTISDPEPRHPLPPQIFNDDVYCGDYDQFDMANEIDEMEKFLKLAPDDAATTITSSTELKLGNGTAATTNGEQGDQLNGDENNDEDVEKNGKTEENDELNEQEKENPKQDEEKEENKVEDEEKPEEQAVAEEEEEEEKAES